MSDRKEFEQWYACNAFNYERDPIGSRDCGLQWPAWQAGQERLRAELTEARKPDCRTCMHRDVGICRLAVHRACVNGDGHMPYLPLRLYEKEGT